MSVGPGNSQRKCVIKIAILRRDVKNRIQSVSKILANRISNQRQSNSQILHHLRLATDRLC